MKRYAVYVTEAISTEYTIDAGSKSEAIEKILDILGGIRPISATAVELRDKEEINDKIGFTPSSK